MSTLTAEERPFPPTLHVLIAPTQLPADLRLAFRDLDEERVVRETLCVLCPRVLIFGPLELICRP